MINLFIFDIFFLKIGTLGYGGGSSFGGGYGGYGGFGGT